MDFTVLINRINELTAFKNLILSNSKKINELPTETDGEKIIAAYNNTSNETEQFNLTELISQIYLMTNRITQYGTYTRDENTFTFNVGYEWFYNGINYGNIDEIEILIDDAEAGYYRKDIIVTDTNNNLIKVVGFESDTFAIAPETPPGTLFLYEIAIFGDDISEPVTQTSGGVDLPYSGSQSFIVDSSIKVSSVYLNRVVLELTQYTRTGNDLTIIPTLVSGDTIQVRASIL